METPDPKRVSFCGACVREYGCRCGCNKSCWGNVGFVSLVILAWIGGLWAFVGTFVMFPIAIRSLFVVKETNDWNVPLAIVGGLPLAITVTCFVLLILVVLIPFAILKCIDRVGRRQSRENGQPFTPYWFSKCVHQEDPELDPELDTELDPEEPDIFAV